MAREFTKLGYYLAFGGALTFKNARHSIEAVQAVDEKWLLTETDCPYMAPEPVRGTRNEPSNIPYITQKMAEVRNVSLEHMNTTCQDLLRFSSVRERKSLPFQLTTGENAKVSMTTWL